MLRKILLTLLIILVPSFALATPKFDKIVIFGDSLSDTGNLYSLSGHVIPKSPPYNAGMFTNGDVWAGASALEFKSHNIPTENYALGGETVVLHNPTKGFLPITLGMSMDDYYLHHVFSDKSTTLFIFWIGSNDYLSGSSDVDADTNAVIGKMTEQLNSLINSHHATMILVISEPDLGRTPEATEYNTAEQQHQLSLAHNQKLQAAIQQIQASNPEVVIHYFDVFTLFSDILDHPEKYNELYKTHINDTANPCWAGGYTLKQADKATLVHELAAQINHQPGMSPAVLADYISNTPALRESYAVGKQFEAGGEPCSDSDSHIWWDHVHPTGAVHGIMAQIMTSYIKEHYVMNN